jgi:hypothetical protein
VLTDLFVIQMLTWFRESPMRWFALLGSPFLAAAVLALVATLLSDEGTTVMTAVALLTATTFLGCLLLGLLGEFVIQGEGGKRARQAVFREWRKGV